MISRIWVFPAILIAAATVAAALIIVFTAVIIYPGLPPLDELIDYKPKVPLRIYSAEGQLIGEFGEERRAVVKIEAVPKIMRDAILAAEDDRFYQHGGVDYVGVIRAALSNLVSGGVRQGASTITMQVARNFFLSRERTITRKFNEILLAFKIEHSLSKDQILELYVNHIYLGQRAYGFAAASQIYFGKALDQLNVAEAAMLAGLPKAPSLFNPVVNPKRAKLRQQYVMRRMNSVLSATNSGRMRTNSNYQSKNTSTIMPSKRIILPRWCGRSSMIAFRMKPTRGASRFTRPYP
jgi:penicillin-binding protein 1A